MIFSNLRELNERFLFCGPVVPAVQVLHTGSVTWSVEKVLILLRHRVSYCIMCVIRVTEATSMMTCYCNNRVKHSICSYFIYGITNKLSKYHPPILTTRWIEDGTCATILMHFSSEGLGGNVLKRWHVVLIHFPLVLLRRNALKLLHKYHPQSI